MLTALQYLIRHNYVDCNVAINRAMLDTWDDDVFSSDILEILFLLVFMCRFVRNPSVRLNFQFVFKNL